MKNRITELLKRKNKDLLSVFYTAGFPELDSTVPIARFLDEAGADIIEIGIPFSDPVADGPTIQQSNKAALHNGMNLKLLLEQVREIRKTKTGIPVILMGYFNPVMQYGVEKFAEDASLAGVDGVIIPDMPLEEYDEHYKNIFTRTDLSNTFLVSPTTSEERIRKIDAASCGFIYAVSASSTTGARENFTEDQITYFKRLKNMKLKNPFLIGFGISNHETFMTASRYGNGAIIGSAFIHLLRDSKDHQKDISRFIQSLRG